jgi:hypothetical protein
MPTKKSSPTATKKKGMTARHKSSSNGYALVFVPKTADNSNGVRCPPLRANPGTETKAERKERLEARESRTLQAFHAAYEGHHRGRRKAS